MLHCHVTLCFVLILSGMTGEPLLITDDGHRRRIRTADVGRYNSVPISCPWTTIYP